MEQRMNECRIESKYNQLVEMVRRVEFRAMELARVRRLDDGAPFFARLKSSFLLAFLALHAGLPNRVSAADKPPAVGDEFPDFELETPDEEKVSLEKLRETGPTVVVVLR